MLARQLALGAIAALLIWPGVGALAEEGKPKAKPSAAEPAAADKEAPAADQMGTAVVDGFRSAKFGMTEEEVGKVITTDFRGQDIKVSKARNPVEKTTLLSIEVKDIIPFSGPARVVYIFGFKSKTLIQVDVLWGNPIDSKPDPEVLAGTANILRDHFAAEGFAPDKMVRNVARGDGHIIVFRGIDNEERMVLLLLNVPQKKDGKEGATAAEGDSKQAERDLSQMSLRLSYILNTKEPDIYRVGKGQF